MEKVVEIDKDNYSQTKNSIDEQLLKKLKQNIQNEPLPGFEESRFILIRHGFSKFNYFWDSNKADHGGNALDGDIGKQFRFDLNLKDCSLHEIGVQQAIYQQQFVNKLEFDIIFVSPLQRALETARFVFATHPNRKHIKFIVLPSLAEDLGLICSIALDTCFEVRKQYEQLSQTCNLNFDFSLMDEFQNKMLWQIEQIPDQALKRELESRFEDVKGNREGCLQRFIQYIKEIYPIHVEKKTDVFQRGNIITKKAIKEYLVKFNQSNQGSKNLKYGIVAHAFLLKALTSTQFNAETGEMNGLRLKNCQIVPYKFDFEDQVFSNNNKEVDKK